LIPWDATPSPTPATSSPLLRYFAETKTKDERNCYTTDFGWQEKRHTGNGCMPRWDFENIYYPVETDHCSSLAGSVFSFPPNEVYFSHPLPDDGQNFIVHNTPMLSPTEKTLLQELLALAPIPEQTFSYHELMGFMFGLAITPVHIPANEWMPVIFGEDESGISAQDQARSMSTVLDQVYNTFMARKTRNDLHFPYELETLEHSNLEEVLEWVSGFEEALGLRPEIWDPGDESPMEPDTVDELYFSLMVIQGLVDPEDIMPFFERLPGEVLEEAFIAFDPEQDRKLQIQGFLLATLPLAVKTLIGYADKVAATLPTRLRINRKSTSRKTPSRPSASADKAKPKGNVIKVDFGGGKKQQKGKRAPHAIYQLKIALKGAKPPIWRRVLVPDTVTLADLHDIIQICMGWFGGHLHQFRIGTTIYGQLLDDDWGFETIADENNYTLHNLAKAITPHFSYTYDFGDNWEHRITVEKSLPAAEGKSYPILVKGKRACPPEDCGGIWGYREFLEAYNNPQHEGYDDAHEWIGSDFDSERFDRDEAEEINAALKKRFS